MSENQFYSLMNDTKWEEIRDAVNNSTDKIHWRTKDIMNGYISQWDGDWYYHFRDGRHRAIERLEIKVETDDLKKKVLAILQEIHVPGKVFKDSIRIYGYAKTSEAVDYL